MTTSRTIGTLFVISGLLGIVILTLDSVLRTGAPDHYDILILFVIIDFLVGAFAFPMPQKLMLRVAVLWSGVRIVLQLWGRSVGTYVSIQHCAVRRLSLQSGQYSSGQLG